MEELATLTTEDLRDQLDGFTGTDDWHKVSAFGLLATDGVKFLAETAGAYWFMDVIASHLSTVRKKDRDERFVIALLTVRPNRSATFRLVNDTGADAITYAQQRIEWTDFPLDSIKLYVQLTNSGWTVCLPSEY